MAVSDISYDSARPPTWGRGIAVHSSTSSSSSSRPPTPDPATYAGGPPNLDEFINGPLYNSGAYVEDVDVDAARNPKRRRLIHQASRRIIGRKAADQELIVSLFNELDSAMLQLQESNVASDNGQQSKTEIQRLQAISRDQRTDRALGAAARRLSSTAYEGIVTTTTMRSRRERMVSNDSKARSLSVKESSRGSPTKSTRCAATLLISTSSWTNSAASAQHYERKYKSYEPHWRTATRGCWKIATMRSPPWKRVTHTREARDSLQLRHNEAVRTLGTNNDVARRATSEGPGDRGYS